MSRLCFLSMRDIAAVLSVFLFGFFMICLNTYGEMIAEGSDPPAVTVSNPTFDNEKDVRCGYHAIRTVANLLDCDRGILEKTLPDAPALSAAQCIEHLEKIGLSVEPSKLVGNIFAAIDSGISERGDGCVAMVLLFRTDQTKSDLGHYFVCFRSDENAMLMLDPTVNKVVPFSKISGGPSTCICLFVTNDMKQFIPKRIERNLGVLCWTGVFLAMPFLVFGGSWSFRRYVPWACATCLGVLLFQSYFHRIALATLAPSANRNYSVPPSNPETRTEEIVVDIGTHVENEQVDFSFEWANRFAEPIKMIRLSPSCSCIRLQFDTAAVSPGKLFRGKGTISLTGVGNVEQRLVGSMRLNDGTEREFQVRIQGQAERDLSMEVTRSTIGIIRPGVGSNPIPMRWKSTSQTYRFVSFAPKNPSNSVLKVDPVTLNEDQLGFEAVFRSDGRSDQLGSFNEKWNLVFDDRNGKRVVLSLTVEGLVQNGPITIPDGIVMYDGRTSLVNLYVPSGLTMANVVHSVEPADLCNVEIVPETRSNEVWSIGKLSCTIAKSESTELRTGRIVFRGRLTQNVMSAIQLYVFPETPQHELAQPNDR